MKWGIAAVCVVAVGLGIVIIGCKNFNYIAFRIDTREGVAQRVYVTLGGQEQYLLIRGKNVQNPVIIWLHGGPSSPDTFLNHIF